MSKPKTLLQQTMVLPLLKLGTLTLRTICKPIANRLKNEAGVNPRFRQFIINIAQANHRFTTKLQRRASGCVTDAFKRRESCSSLCRSSRGTFAFTVAGAALVYDVQRNARGEARKEEKLQQELAEFRRRHDKMDSEIEEMNQRCRKLYEEPSKPREFNEELSKPRGLTWLFSSMCYWSAAKKIQ